MQKIGKNVFIHPEARIDVDYLEIGDFSKINKGVIITGRKVIIGREAWLDEGARIGGGRATVGTVRIGDFFHLGKNAEINTANDVLIGDEVGIGMDSKIFTHGAYLSEIDGFPYQDAPVLIGNRVWIPNAIVMPGVCIGSNVVIGAMSLVNKSIPNGCFAAGIPIKVVKENEYPKVLIYVEIRKILLRVIEEAYKYHVSADFIVPDIVYVEGTSFFTRDRIIVGKVNSDTERVKDILRRHGIRFRYYNKDGEYVEWEKNSSFESTC